MAHKATLSLLLTFLLSACAPVMNVETIDQPPSFPGGVKAMIDFFRENLHEPLITQDQCILGNVAVEFIVEKDGRITHIHILRSPEPRWNQEAIRVCRLMPRWQPAMHQGRRVRAQYVIPIIFRPRN